MLSLTRYQFIRYHSITSSFHSLPLIITNDHLFIIDHSTMISFIIVHFFSIIHIRTLTNSLIAIKFLCLSLIFSNILFFRLLQSFIFRPISFHYSLIFLGNLSLILSFRGSNLGPYFQFLHFSFAVGSTVSPLIIGAVMDANKNSFNLAYAILATFFIPFILFLFIQDSPKEEEATEKGTLS